MSLSSDCKHAILQIVGNDGMNIAEIVELIPTYLPVLGDDYTEYYSYIFPVGSPNAGNSRLQIAARVCLAGLARDEPKQIIRPVKGVYQRNPEFVPEEAGEIMGSDISLAVAFDEVKLEEGAHGYIYAFTYPAYQGNRVWPTPWLTG